MCKSKTNISNTKFERFITHYNLYATRNHATCDLFYRDHDFVVEVVILQGVSVCLTFFSLTEEIITFTLSLSSYSS